MGRKSENKKFFTSRRGKFLLAFLVVITLFNFNKTTSRYMAEIASNTDAIAVPVLTFANTGLSYNFDNMIPGETREITFSVSNTDEGRQNEVLLKYYLELATDTTIPLQFKLYEITNGTENEIALTNNRTPEGTVGFDSQYIKNYKLKIIWNSSDSSFEYAGKSANCNIKLAAEQVVE